MTHDPTTTTTRRAAMALLGGAVAAAALPAPAVAQGEPIKLGFMSGFTGPGRTIAERTLQGVQLAVDEFNAAGGVLGRQIELLVRDDESNPSRAVTLARELVDRERIDAMVGPTLTGTAVATTPVFTEAKVLQLISGTGVPLDVDQYPYVFRTAFGTREQAAVMVKYADENLKLEKLGLVGDSTPLGRNGAADIQKALEGRRLKLAGSEFFNTGDLDMTPQLTRLRDAGAGAFSLYAVGADLANCLRSRRNMGWDAPVLGHIALSLKGVIDLIGPELAGGVTAVMMKAFAAGPDGVLPERTVRFREALVAKFGSLNDTIYLQAVYYDPVVVFRHAAEAAGSLDADAMRAALEGTTGLDVTQGRLRFSPADHSGFGVEEMTLVDITTLENGTFRKAPDAP